MKVSKLVKQEVLMVNIGSTSTGGKVLNVKAVVSSSGYPLTDRISPKLLSLSPHVWKLERR